MFNLLCDLVEIEGITYRAFYDRDTLGMRVIVTSDKFPEIPSSWSSVDRIYTADFGSMIAEYVEMPSLEDRLYQLDVPQTVRQWLEALHDESPTFPVMMVFDLDLIPTAKAVTAYHYSGNQLVTKDITHESFSQVSS